MKKLIFSFLLAVIAIGGSAYKYAGKSITENFLVQPSTGTFTRLAMASGTCTSNSGMNCKYAVTALGRLNIPSQSSYTAASVQEFLDDDWIEAIPGVGPGTYHPI